MLPGLFLSAANHVLDDAPWARKRLSAHPGARARLHLAGRSFEFSIDALGYLAESAGSDEVDVSIEMPLPSFSELAGGIDMLMRSARVNGNIEIADSLGFVFRNLRWDAEGDLARVIGDIGARRVAGLFESVVAMQRRAGGSLVANLREFITDGATPLVSAPVSAARAEQLRVLRDDLARLGKRVGRLERSAAEDPPRRPSGED